MTRLMKTLAAVVIAAGMFGLVPSAHADEWNKKTILTTNEPIEIPGAVLQPGTYVMKLVDSQSNRHIVRFMNEAEDETIATVIALPNERLHPTGETQFGWYETPANQPPAMRAWFYPGNLFGQEFVYPTKRGSEIASETGRSVPTMENDNSNVVAVNSQGEQTDVEAANEANQQVDQTKPMNPEVSVSEETVEIAQAPNADEQAAQQRQAQAQAQREQQQRQAQGDAA